MKKISSKKKLVGLIIAVATVVSCMCSVFAESEVVASMGTAMEPVKTDALSALATVAPYGIAIMGAFLVWKFGIRFFKSLAK